MTTTFRKMHEAISVAESGFPMQFKRVGSHNWYDLEVGRHELNFKDYEYRRKPEKSEMPFFEAINEAIDEEELTVHNELGSAERHREIAEQVAVEYLTESVGRNVEVGGISNFKTDLTNRIADAIKKAIDEEKTLQQYAGAEGKVTWHSKPKELKSFEFTLKPVVIKINRNGNMMLQLAFRGRNHEYYVYRNGMQRIAMERGGQNGYVAEVEQSECEQDWGFAWPQWWVGLFGGKDRDERVRYDYYADSDTDKMARIEIDAIVSLLVEKGVIAQEEYAIRCDEEVAESVKAGL